MKNSLVDAVLTHMSDQKVKNSLTEFTKTARIAQRCQKQPSDNAVMRIGQLFRALRKERRLAKAANASVELKPESMPNFVQKVSNQVCWTVRRLARLVEEEAQDDQLDNFDFYQDMASQLNVDPQSIRELVDGAEMDAYALSGLYLFITSTMSSYLPDLPNFAMYQESGPKIDKETGEEEVDPETGRVIWEITATADTYDAARVIMDRAVDRLNAESDDREDAALDKMDFYANRPVINQPKEQDPVAQTLAAKYPKPEQKAKGAKKAAKKPAAKKTAKKPAAKKPAKKAATKKKAA